MKEYLNMAITNVREVFDKVSRAFDPDAAKGLDAVFQFDITGDGGGMWNVAVKDGTCKVEEGKAEAPTVALTMSSETWLSMVNKEINGIQAFMSGKLQLTGDMLLAQRIPDLFKF
jgi:putative sterol carrier protein